MRDAGGPVAGRLRRPSWRDPRLLVGLLLIAVAVVAVVTALQRADRTQPFYAARHDLAAGQAIAESDVVVVHVRVSAADYVASPASPWGLVLNRPVGTGELVPRGALTDPEAYGSRSIAVVTALPLASDIGIGSIVDLWVTVAGSAGPSSTLVGTGLSVVDVARSEGAFSAGRSQTVYLSVPAADVPRVLDAIASDGDVAIVGTAG